LGIITLLTLLVIGAVIVGSMSRTQKPA